jgi:Flp pilus assembly protein TadG
MRAIGGRRRRVTGTSRKTRGAALLEAALVTPVLMVFLFGIIEFGFGFYGRLTVRHMSLSGARTASSQGADVYSDYTMLQAIKKNAADMKQSNITTIVIYRASGPSDRVPAACKTGSVVNTAATRGCNRYVGSDLSRPQTDFGCDDAGGNRTLIDRFWCPTDRKTAIKSTNGNGPPDYVGVYVEGKQNSLTRMFGKTQYTFTSDTVIRIEPRTLS